MVVMTSTTGASEVGSPAITPGTDPMTPTTVTTAFVIGTTTVDTGAMGSVAELAIGCVTGATSVVTGATSVSAASGVAVSSTESETLASVWEAVCDCVSRRFAASACCLPSFPINVSVLVTVFCNAEPGVGVAVLTAGSLAEVAVEPAPSTELCGAESVVSSAAAIPPPALPMRRPAESMQIPAARRSCVEMRISSHQQGSPTGQLPLPIVACFGHQLSPFCGEILLCLSAANQFSRIRRSWHSPNGEL
jgi:hypothetical protein